MAEYYDIYALASERTPEIIQTFIAHFVPYNSTGDRQYEYNLRAADSSLAYCGHDFSRFVSLACTEGTLYGGARIYEPGKTGGWVYFNDDASLVLGLSTRSDRALKTLKRLVDAIGCGWGYIAGDGPPRSSKDSFVETCVDALKDFVVRPSRLSSAQEPHDK